MTPRLLTAFAFLMATTACTPTVIPLTLKDPAEPYFVQVLEGTAAERAEALAVLKKEHSDSPWSARGRTVAETMRNRDALAQKVKQAEQDKGAAQQERTACQQENLALQQETARLREDLDKLKKLLINMEKRSSK